MFPQTRCLNFKYLKISKRNSGSLLKSNILESIGRTPVIKINRLSPEGRTIYVKNESLQPSHSVKARLALAIIEVFFTIKIVALNFK